MLLAPCPVRFQIVADVFISYARPDREKIEILASALQQQGFSVWWDRQVSGGDNFSTEIERELELAASVIVAWSDSGSKSNWVKDEASVGAKAGKLIAVSIDGTDPPLGYRQFHCLDLSQWPGNPKDAEVAEVVRAIKAKIAGESIPVAAPGSPMGGRSPAISRKMTGVIISVVVLVVALGFMAIRGKGESIQHPAATENAPVPPQVLVDDKSIAVLPFASMSSSEEDQFLADGLSEELLNVLAQINDLKVVSRTSSFAFRDSELGVQQIGETLNVAHVLEGSVRRSGDRLRITAQLINVDDGYHLWSDTYDRDSDDVLAIQDDIARRVSKALQSALVSDDDVPLFDVGTGNGQAYRLYLEGRALLNRRGLDVAKAISRFEEAIALDPEYARAYAGLSSAHLVSSNYLRTPTSIARKRAESNAHKAIELNPALSEPVAVLAMSEIEQNNWEAGVDLFDRALALDPGDVVALQWSAEALMYLGYIDLALARMKSALAIEPESAILNLVTGNACVLVGDLDAGFEYYELARQYGMAHAVLNQGLIELQRGEVQSAARDFARNMYAMQFLAEEEVEPMTEFLKSIISGEKSVDGSIEAFPALAADDDFRAVMYLYAGEVRSALQMIEIDVDKDKDTFFKVWSDIVPGIRQDPYFLTFAQNTGLLEYWQAHGWPDKCQPLEEGGFECI